MPDNRDQESRHLKPVNSSSGALAVYDPLQSVPQDEDSIDLREYWRMIVKRKWVVISILVFAIVISMLATMLTIPVYRSSAVIQITYESPRILQIQDFTPESRGWGGREQFFNSQYDILRSRALAESVVEREGVYNHPELSGEIQQRSLIGEIRALPGRLIGVFSRADDSTSRPARSAEQAREAAIRRAARTLRSRITVTPRRDSNLVNIQVSSFDPQFAARMANAIVDEYIRSTLQRRYDAGQEAREFLEEQLSDMRIALERADQNLQDFASDIGVADLQDRVQMAQSALRTLNDRLNSAQANLVQNEAYMSLIENGRGNDIRPVLADSRLRELVNRRSELSSEYAGLTRRFQEGYPAVMELQVKMNELDARIAERRDSIITEIRSEYATLQAEIDALETAIEDREGQILALNQQGVQYNILRREFTTNRELYDGMLQRMKEIGVAAGIQNNNIAMIESANAPGSPFLPNMQRNLGMALMLGLALGIGLALVLEFLDTTIRRTEDIERMVGRPVLGMIPMVKLREQREKSGINDVRESRAISHYSELHPKSAVSEAFRSLRTSLMFSTPEGMPKSILITSPGPGDGKTTNAINLATVMAQNGAKVLLIDADLRKPRMHRDFGIPHAPGLTNRIAGASNGDGSSAIVPTTVDGLFVMPSGSHAPNPAELLSSERMRKIINMASRAFDHVIIDTAPILGLADSLVLSRAVDGVIMVAAAGRTSKDSIKASTRRLMQVQAPLLGVILNQVDLDSPDYAYYSAYYYNYSGEPETEEKRLPKAASDIA
jgi:polysaccharide biosynthesis transport protein